jgi:hypothetical protein
MGQDKHSKLNVWSFREKKGVLAMKPDSGVSHDKSQSFSNHLERKKYISIKYSRGQYKQYRP